MRKYFGATADEIAANLERLPPGTPLFQDYLDELRNRSSSRARQLLEKYSRKVPPKSQERTLEDRLADVRKALTQIEKTQESMREALAILERRAAEPLPDLTKAVPAWSYEKYLADKARQEQLELEREERERERVRQNNQVMWTQLELQQRRENLIRDRLLALPTEGLLELWERKSWITENGVNEAEHNLLKAILRARIL